jgi:hypothetical protein
MRLPLRARRNDSAKWRRKAKRAMRKRASRLAALEALETRAMLSVQAVFESSSHIFTVTGDGSPHTIAVLSDTGNVKVTSDGNLVSISPAVAANNVWLLVVNGSAANETIDISNVDTGVFTSLASISLDGQGGSDSYNIDQSKIGFATATSVQDSGTSGSDWLTVGTNSTTGETVGVASNTVTRSHGTSPVITNGTVTYVGIETLEVNTSASGDTVTVSSTSAASIVVHTGNGPDSITVTQTAALGSVTVDGGSGGSNVDSLMVESDVHTPQSIGISNGAVTRAGYGTVNHSNFESLMVNSDIASDLVTINLTSGAVNTTVNTGGADDTVIVQSWAATSLRHAGQKTGFLRPSCSKRPSK